MESASAISAGLQPGRSLNQINTDSGIPNPIQSVRMALSSKLTNVY
jgi:hypothetical protein